MREPAAVVAFADLVERALAVAAPDQPARGQPERPWAGAAVLGVVGPPGAGKTTLARAVVAAVAARLGEQAVCHVPMDGFHLADVELDRLGRRDWKGASDTFDAAGYAALLARISSGGEVVVYAPMFERDLEQPIAGAIPILPGTRLVVTEGLYLLGDGPWRVVRALMKETWYVDPLEPGGTARLVARHEEFGKSHQQAVAWVARVDDRNADQVRATRPRADVVVPGDLQLPTTAPPS